MALDPKLLEILACPEDKGPLLYFEDEQALYNPRLHRRYDVRDDIPVMLIDEASAVNDAEHARLLAKAETDGVRPTFEAAERAAGASASRAWRRWVWGAAPGRCGVTDVLDTLGMFPATAGLPEQVFDAAVRARGLSDLPDRERIENIVVLGMGGSGVAGDVLIAAAGPFLPVPVIVSKGYELPAFVGESSLVFAISFSGNTEETVEAASAAAVEGAHMVVITQGGELGRLADSWGVPKVTIPTDIPVPRAGLGAVAVPPLIVLEDVGLFPGAQQWVDFAVEQLRERREQLLADDSPAKQLAKHLGRTIPLVHGGGDLGAVAAARWKTQVNENANAPAFWNTHPELCHNEMQGWGQHGDVTRQVLTLVNLRHEFEHPQVARRFDVVQPLLDEVVASVQEVWAEGEGQLAQLLDLVLFGDFVSLELAAQEGIDPGPMDTLDQIKRDVTLS